MNQLSTYEAKALELDAQDPLRGYREHFVFPKDVRGNPQIYFCNNSLGLPAKAAIKKMNVQMQAWADYGVEGWFNKDINWYTGFDKALRDPLSRLLGASYDEVMVMHSLTTNLHLLLVSFYRPTESRYKILIEAPIFPSDLYAIKSQLSFHGLDPDQALVIVEPPVGEYLLRQEDIEKVFSEQGDSIALVFLSSVNFLTGQLLDMERITSKAKQHGCIVGFDLAHAAGNVPLDLHGWDIDFAVGCSYKYLCSGPGGPGIAFVHSRHHNSDLPRLSGWWGNDPNTRFKMQLQPDFVPYGGAQAWQLGTPSILAMMPLVASLELFDQAGIKNLRIKSKLQTTFLLELLKSMENRVFEIITPEEINERGSQLSLLFKNDCEGVLSQLENHGMICDFRPPNVIRVTPAALYNTFYEIYDFVKRLDKLLKLP
jgi:kynureninase